MAMRLAQFSSFLSGKETASNPLGQALLGTDNLLWQMRRAGMRVQFIGESLLVVHFLTTPRFPSQITNYISVGWMVFCK